MVTVTTLKSKTDSKLGLQYGRQMAAHATGDTVERGSVVPVPVVINVVLRALTDPRFKKAATPLQILGILAPHADERGIIHPAPDGQMVTDPEHISHVLGVTKVAVWRAYNLLVSLGYITWDKAARGAERSSGVTGRIRIITSAQA